MAITIDTYELPAGLIWTDEYLWTGVARAMERSVTGVPIIQTTALTSGRTITFASADKAAWLKRTDLDALIALIALDGDRVLTLHDGRTCNVQFLDPSHAAEQLVDYEHPIDEDWYVLTQLNLITTGEMQPPEDPEEPEE